VLKKIPSEPYPELHLVLERFVAGVKNAVREKFVGAYLVGSLAIGDFDLDSDIDFLIVTNSELNDAEVQSLQALHVELQDLGCYPARHLEGSYVSRELLNRTDLIGAEPLWYVDNGSTRLKRSVHDNTWHVRWVLRECAITIAGPDPETLVPPVAIPELQTEMLDSIEKLRTYFVSEIDKPVVYFNTRFGQSFAVLTCCRILHTFVSGAVKSKLAAVQWAEQALPSEWLDLICQAWTEREGVRFGVKIRQPADARLLEETARFLGYAQNELRRLFIRSRENH
jgi:predicted nucleotidyltransferase